MIQRRAQALVENALGYQAAVALSPSTNSFIKYTIIRVCELLP